MSQTPSNIADLLRSKWSAGFELAANEERVITMHFTDKSDGAKGIENLLTIRKINAATAQTNLASTYPDSVTTALTFQTITDDKVTVSPSFDYSAVQIPLHSLSRIDDESGLEGAYKKQLLASLATSLDAAGALLAASLTTNIVGSGGVNIDKTLLLEGWNKVLIGAKDKFRPGTTKGNLVIYSAQARHLMNTADFTYSYITGESESPLRRGWVNQALNLTVEESGNIYTASGVAHNMLWVDEAFVIAFNLKPQILPVQYFDALVKMIAVQERGVATLWDEYACDVQTSSA